MSMFYLLPPRSLLTDRLADQLHSLLPGVDLDVASRDRLWQSISEALLGDDVFLVHREDLPPGEAAEQALIDGYGAARGDEVVEVRLAGRPGAFTSRRWRIGAGADSLAPLSPPARAVGGESPSSVMQAYRSSPEELKRGE
jgi:hypothetical protein